MSHPENNPNFLAAELGDDGKVRITWPDDPLVAQQLFVELEYRFKARQIEDALRLRTMSREMEERGRIAAAAGKIRGIRA